MGPQWLDRLEKRWGWLAVPGLASFLAVMSAAVALLTLMNGAFPARLSLDPQALRHGEVWRALTFILVPPQMRPLFLILWIFLIYSYLIRLEAAWGDFKLTVYCLIGAAALTAAALAVDIELSNSIFQASLFLAFARLFPEFEILIFFVLPVKMKWLALITWASIALSLLFGGTADRVAWMLGLVNYALFFGREHWQDAQPAIRRWRRK